MSTSDSSAETVLKDGEDTQKSPARGLASLPDLEVITRLANELFAAMPVQLPGTGSLPASPSIPSEVKSPATKDVAGVSPATVPTTATNVPPSFPAGPHQADLPQARQERANSLGSVPTYPSAEALFSFPGEIGRASC